MEIDSISRELYKKESTRDGLVFPDLDVPLAMLWYISILQRIKLYCKVVDMDILQTDASNFNLFLLVT